MALDTWKVFWMPLTAWDSEPVSPAPRARVAARASRGAQPWLIARGRPAALTDPCPTSLVVMTPLPWIPQPWIPQPFDASAPNPYRAASTATVSSTSTAPPRGSAATPTAERV